MAAATSGGWTGTLVSTRVGAMLHAARFEDKPRAEKFGHDVAKPLKAQLASATAKKFGADRRPFKNKSVKAGFGYEIETTPFAVVFELRPGPIWAFGEYGAKPHLIGAPKGARSGSQIARKQKRTGYKTSGGKKAIKAPGYAHPVQGPIYHPGTGYWGAIAYAFKVVRDAQEDATATAWRTYMVRAFEDA